MTDTKTPERNLQDIQQEYINLCNKAGHLQYQIFVYEKDLSILNDTLRSLNFEAAALQAKAPTETASQPTPETATVSG